MDNSGVVTSAAIQLDTQRLAKYTGGKNALVAQGGASVAFLLRVFLMPFFYLISTLLIPFTVLQQVR